jgi:putative phosphoribosyl transferase
MIPTTGLEEAVRLPAGEVELEGDLRIPPAARGLVLLALGSGRSNRRIQEVARVLREARIGTVILDLLTFEEDRQYTRRFDIPCLGERVVHASLALRSYLENDVLRLGILSTGTGAAAALWAASYPQVDVAAVVACEGRLDLVEDHLPDVKAPTLLVAGSRGGEVTRLNADVYSRIPAPKDMIVVPGATDVLDEPFARAELARWATQWFGCFLPAVAAAA